MLKPKTSVQNQRALHYKRFTQIEKSDSLSTLYKTIADDKFWKFDFENQKFIEVQDSTIKSNAKLILITDVSVIKHKDAYFQYINKTWVMIGGKPYYSNYNDWKAGVYDENNNLVFTWEELISNDYIRNTGDGFIGPGTNINNLSGKLVLTKDANNIDSGTFFGLNNLISVTIPDTYFQIPNAFLGCENLKEIIIGKNVYDIRHAFDGCVSLETVYFNSIYVTQDDEAFRAAGRESHGINLIIGKDVDAFNVNFSNTSLRSILCEQDTKLTGFGSFLFNNCTNLKYVIFPIFNITVPYTFQNCFIGCSSDLIIYCGFSEEQVKYLVNQRYFAEDWNLINEETFERAKVIYNYKLPTNLSTYFSKISNYQTNKYYYVDSFDFMKKGSTDRIETQPIRGLITPLESFQIRTFDDNIDLDHDDLVVIDGKLYAIESIEVVEKRVPKKFRIYFATVTSIL